MFTLPILAPRKHFFIILCSLLQVIVSESETKIYFYVSYDSSLFARELTLNKKINAMENGS